MGYNGDLYPTAGADVVMTTSGDLVKFTTARARLPIGSTNQILQVKSALPSWETVPLADTVLTTAGDVLYENATPELARLPIASNGDVLTLAGGLPTWATPASGSVWTEIADVTLTGTGNLASGTFSHYDQLQVYCWRKNSSGNSTGLIFNSTGASNQYSSHYLTDMTTVEDYASTHSVIINGSYNTTEPWFINMNIMNLDGEEKLCTWNAVLQTSTGNVSLGTSVGMAKTTFTTDITSIQCTADGGGLIDQLSGSRMIVMGANA